MQKTSDVDFADIFGVETNLIWNTELFGIISLFNGISTFMAYLMANPFLWKYSRVNIQTHGWG